MKALTVTMEVLTESVYEFLIDDDESKSSMSLKAFRKEWADWGMIVAIYNLGWTHGSQQEKGIMVKTPYTETEALVAMMQSKPEDAKELIRAMTESELHGLDTAVYSLHILVEQELSNRVE